MASAAAGRVTQAMNSMYFMSMVRKSFYGKTGSPDIVNDKIKLNLNGDESKNKVPEEAAAGKGNASWWIQDDRTGNFYSKGQEKVIENVPPLEDLERKECGSINWFG